MSSWKMKKKLSIHEDDKEKCAELLALPPHGSEIFVGGLPRDVSEEDLRDLCESVDKIIEIKLMKNRDTGEGKGFAFVAFKAKEVAQQAIEELHNREFKDPQNPSQNRGFAFVEYYNNACADYSRQKMSSANFKMDGNAPTVSWADPKNVPDNSAAVSQVDVVL